MVYESITPDIVADLTDTTERPLTVYVEDDLAEMIVASVIDNLEVTRFTSVKKYGSSENAFTLAAGLVLHEDTSLDNKLIVLDGDVFRSEEEKRKQLKMKLSGTEAAHNQKIETALAMITQLQLPENTAPEKYIHSMILDVGLEDDISNEILHCAKRISTVRNSHDWINGIVEQLGRDRNVVLFQIIQNTISHSNWDTYVSNVYSWLKTKKAALHL